MEVKFLANILVMLLGYKSVDRLIEAMVTGERNTIGKHGIYLLIYSLLSSLSICSYLIEAPISYELIPNLLIGSESASALLLILTLVRIYVLNSKEMFGGPEKDLTKLLSHNNNSEDEDVVTFTRIHVHKQTK